MKEKPPRAWMRRWAYDGVKEYREPTGKGGRMRIARKFLILPVTPHKVFNDDVPLFSEEDLKP